MDSGNRMANPRLALAAAIAVSCLITAAAFVRTTEPPTPEDMEAAIMSYARRGLLPPWDLSTFGNGDIEYLKGCVGLSNSKYGTRLRGVAFNPLELNVEWVN